MSTQNTDAQLASLRSRIGEPVDPLQARWTPDQLLDFLNGSRRIVSEETRCYQVVDSQVITPSIFPAPGSPFLISVTNDFIWCEEFEYAGRPLRVVRAQDWRDVVGQDDTINGDPSVVLYFGRKFQIFAVPNSMPNTQSGALSYIRYRGWAYPPDMVSGGVDASFVQRVADVCIWHCAMTIKGSDERNNSHEASMTETGIAELKKQYMPRGPRYIRTGELYLPWRPLP